MHRPVELPPYSPRPQRAPTALGGLRVIDFSHFVAGPLCTMMLGDLGADIIKIENSAHGDDMRENDPQIGGIGGPFFWGNRNKRSVALNLRIAEAQAAALELIAQADVVVENFSAGVMEKFGLGYESLSKMNPRLVYCAVSAAGRQGILAGRLGFDPIAQAESGFMSINGHPNGPAVIAGTPFIDITSGMMACNAILAALYERERSGEGQYVEVAMLDQAILMLSFKATNYLITGIEPKRIGNSSAASAPVGVYRTRDGGSIYLACASDRTFKRLADALGRADLAADHRFARASERLANRAALDVILSETFEQEKRDAMMEKLRATGVPAAPVLSVAEALSGPDVGARGLLTSIPHPTAGAVPNIASPIRMSRTPVVDPIAAPPLGYHTDEVLRDILGYDQDHIAAMRRNGALKAEMRE